MVVLTTWAGRWRLYLPCCVFKKPLSSTLFIFSTAMKRAKRQRHGKLIQSIVNGTSLTTIPLKQPAILVPVSNLENNCLALVTARTCRLMTSVSVAGGTETRVWHVGCSSGNKQRNAECAGTCQSKQRSSQTSQQHGTHRYKEKPEWSKKINSARECRRQSTLFPILSWKDQDYGSRSNSFGPKWAELPYFAWVQSCLFYFVFHTVPLKSWDIHYCLFMSIGRGAAQWLWAPSHPPIYAPPHELT